MRNYVLMGQDPFDFQNKLYETYWYPMEQRFGKEYTKRFHLFIRDYLTLKLRGRSIDEAEAVWVLSEPFREPIYERFQKICG